LNPKGRPKRNERFWFKVASAGKAMYSALVFALHVLSRGCFSRKVKPMQNMPLYTEFVTFRKVIFLALGVKWLSR